MIPDQIEACARRAFEILVANTGEAADWAAVKNKTAWIDAVNSHDQHPDAIQRKQDPNLQERCIAQAYREMNQPAARQPLVVPPASEAAKAPAKAKKETEAK